MRRFTVAIIGSASGLTKHDRLEVEKLSRFLALDGCDLVTGGMGGVMRAVSRGHYRSNSTSSLIHLTPGWESNKIINPYPSSNVQTKMGEMRNTLVVRSADAVIAISGGAGTLSEIALAWQNGLPVACYGSMGGWSERLAGQTLDDRRDDVMIQLNSMEDVETWLNTISGKGHYHYRTGTELYTSLIPYVSNQIQADPHKLKSSLETLELAIGDSGRACVALVFVENCEDAQKTIDILKNYTKLQPILVKGPNTISFVEPPYGFVQNALHLNKTVSHKEVERELEELEDSGELPWIVHETEETMFNDEEAKSLGITQQFIILETDTNHYPHKYHIVSRW